MIDPTIFMSYMIISEEAYINLVFAADHSEKTELRPDLPNN